MRRLLVALVLAHLVVVWAGVALVLPFGQGFDEHTHMQYVAWLALERRLPDQRVDAIRAAQHPPAYHVALALLYGALRDPRPLAEEPAASPDAPASDAGTPGPVVLPYEHRVALPFRERVPDLHAEAARRAARDAPEDVPRESVRGWLLYALRASGLLVLLGTAAALFGALERTFPDRPVVATLAAATSLLVPLVPGVFAMLGNDAFATLWCSLAVAALLGARARGRLHDVGPVLIAAACFGLAFATKLWSVGAFGAAATLLALDGGTSPGPRARSLALLAAGPAALAGWWVVHRTLTAGSPLGSGIQVARWPEYLRGRSPDAPLGYLAELAQTIPTWVGRLGILDHTPGESWVALATAWPVLLLASLVACACCRAARGRDRLLAASFTVGLLVQLAAMVVFARRYAGAHGRYMLPLLVPGTAALVAGLPHLTGRATRGLLAGFLVLMAVGGVLLVHGDVLPTFGTPHAWARAPDVVAAVDVGLPENEAGTVVRGGTPIQTFLQEYPTVASRGRLLRVQGGSVVVVFDGLDPADLLHVEPRLLDHGPPNELGLRSAATIDAGTHRIAGPLGAWVVQGGTSLPVPPEAVANGRLRITVTHAEGLATGLAALVLRRLPLRLEEVAVEAGGRRVARFASDAPDRLPPLEASLRLGDFAGPRAPLVHRGDGVVSCVLDPPPGVEGAATLLLHGAAAPVVDVELYPERTDAAGIALDDRAPSGLAVDASTCAPGEDVARVPERWLPVGPCVVHLLAPGGEDACSAFRLHGVHATPRRVDGHWTADLDAAVTGEERLRVVREAGLDDDALPRLDRLQVRRGSTWALALPGDARDG